MTSTDLGWALLFLVLVAVFIAVGIVVGMIVAGRIDRLQAPRRATPPEDAVATGSEPAIPADPSQEEQQP